MPLVSALCGTALHDSNWDPHPTSARLSFIVTGPVSWRELSDVTGRGASVKPYPLLRTRYSCRLPGVGQFANSEYTFARTSDVTRRFDWYSCQKYCTDIDCLTATCRATQDVVGASVQYVPICGSKCPGVVLWLYHVAILLRFAYIPHQCCNDLILGIL